MDNFISYKTEISEFLISFLNKKQKAHQNSVYSSVVFEKLSQLVVSGKMIRGSLLINTYERLSGKKYSEEVLKAAVAIELAGTGFLIHDDVIDQDNLRRGQETFHAQHQGLAKDREYQNPEKFGESIAICVGDVVFFLVYELLTMKLVPVFSHQLSITALGEMHDVELALMNGEEIDRDNILQMYLDKTAGYTICLPLIAGAILANRNEQVVSQLDELGKNIGLIFQIKDDEIGLFGDQNKTGKPIGADIREGKKTLYYYYLLQKAGVKAEGDKVDNILKLIEKYQVRELVKKDLDELTNKVQSQINKLTTNVETKEMLVYFLDKMTNRVR